MRGRALQDIQRIVAQSSAMLTLSTSDKASITSQPPPSLDEFVTQIMYILNQYRSALPNPLSVVTDFVTTPQTMENGHDEGDGQGENELTKSVFQGLDSEILDMLNKVDLEAAREEIISALHKEDLPSFASLALKHPILVTERDALGGTLLHVALELYKQTKSARQDLTVILLPYIRVLLQNGADPNALTSEGTAPLHLAATLGHVSILREMIRYGGKIELKDRVGRTPLYISTLQGNLECVQACLEAGGSPMTVNKSGCTCVHAAVLRDRPAELKCLFEYVQANWDSKRVYQLLNAQDRDGRTPAHMAASCNLTAIVEQLCRCQGLLDLSVRDRWQQTAWDTATPEARLLLNSLEAKRVVVHLATPSSSPTSPGHTGGGDSMEAQFAVGVIEVQNELTWKDFDLLVGQILEKHCMDLSCSYNMLKERDITALRYVKPSDAAIANSDASQKKGKLKMHRRSSAPNIRDLDSQQQLPQLKHDVTALTEKYWDLLYSPEAKKRQNASGEILAHYFTPEVQLGIDQSSIASYTLGKYTWAPDRYPPDSATSTIYQVLEKELRNLYIEVKSIEMAKSRLHPFTLNLVVRLKGAQEGKLDKLAYQSLTPVVKLESYIDLVLDTKSVIVSGPLGCGKTLLAGYMAECLKQQFSFQGKKAQIVTACLHPSFKREDLLELLVETGCILQMTSTSTPQAICRNKSVVDITPIIVLDNLDQVNITEVLGEFLTSLEFRGLASPHWSAGFSTSSQVKLPPGEYYLRSDSYIIGTLSRSGWSGLSQMVRDHFSHIQCSVFEEPVCGLLNRFLMRSVISQSDGVVIKNNELFSSLQWVSEVWYLYNCYLQKFQLPELQIGPRHFFACPVDCEDWTGIYQWLASLWNHKIAPFIEDQLLLKNAMYSSGNIPSCDVVIANLIQSAVVASCPLSIGHFHEFYRGLRDVKPQVLAPIGIGLEASSTMSLVSLPAGQSGVVLNRPGGGRFSMLDSSGTYPYRSNTLPKKLNQKPPSGAPLQPSQLMQLQQMRSQSVSLHDRKQDKEEKKSKRSGLFKKKVSKDNTQNKPDLIMPVMKGTPEDAEHAVALRSQSYDQELHGRSQSSDDISGEKFKQAQSPNRVMQSEI